MTLLSNGSLEEVNWNRATLLLFGRQIISGQSNKACCWFSKVIMIWAIPWRWWESWWWQWWWWWWLQVGPRRDTGDCSVTRTQCLNCQGPGRGRAWRRKYCVAVDESTSLRISFKNILWILFWCKWLISISDTENYKKCPKIPDVYYCSRGTMRETQRITAWKIHVAPRIS